MTPRRDKPRERGRTGRKIKAVIIALLANLLLFSMAPLMMRSDQGPVNKPVELAVVYTPLPPTPEPMVEPIAEIVIPEPVLPDMEPLPQPPEALEPPPLEPIIPDPPKFETPELEPPPLEQPVVEPEVVPEIMEVPLPKIRAKRKVRVRKKKTKKATVPVESAPSYSQPVYSQPAYSPSSSVASAPAAPRGETRGIQAVRRYQPPYPASARRQGIEGYVRVSITVDSSGSVSSVSVVSSSPPGVFDDTVVNTVYGWRFRPAMQNGQPVSATVTQTVRFSLR